MYFIIIFIFQANSQNLYTSDLPHTAKLAFQPSGYYTLTLRLGSNRTSYDLVLDTGSSMTVLFCSHTPAERLGCSSQCQSCPFLAVSCQFSIKYADESFLKGSYFRDYLLMGDDISQHFDIEKTISKFGCIDQHSKQFAGFAADGILGLAPSSNYDYVFPSLVQDLQNKESPTLGNAFSVCLSQRSGYMSVGGYNHFRHLSDGPLTEVPYYDDQNQYQILVRSINVTRFTIPGETINGGYGAILDTGSTYIFAHSQLYKALLYPYQIYPLQKRDDLWCLESVPPEKLPTIQFELETFVFDWEPSNYLVQLEDALCLPFMEITGKRRLILGQIWMRHYDILFDLGRKSIQFYKTNCSIDRVHTSLSEEELRQIRETRQEFHKEDDGVSSQVGIVLFALVTLLGFWLYRRRQLRSSRPHILLME